MTVKQAMAIEASGKAEFKLSKAATDIMNGDRTIVDKSLDNIKLNDWLGLAQNPLLTDDDIINMYRMLQQQNKDEKDCNETPPSTKTKNKGTRAKIRNTLQMHPKVSDALIKDLLSLSGMGTPMVLKNKNVKREHLDFYFQKKIVPKEGKYNFVTFKDLLQSVNLTNDILIDWYKQLEKMADWTYQDNQWYYVIDAYLEYEDCPFEILKDIVNAPFSGDNDTSWFNRPERYREKAIKQKNSTQELELRAYEITENPIFLPEEAKDIFFIGEE